MKQTSFLLINCLCVLFFICCNKSNENCNSNWQITTAISASHPCVSTGKIEVTAPVGSNYQYKIDDLLFQQQPIFLNLSVGKHRLTIRDNNNCQSSLVVIIDTITPSIQFKQVTEILTNRCINCHSGINPHAGLNFTQPCDILNHWQRIQARAIEGNPSPMPQTGLIPLAERNVLVKWIKDGSKYSE